MVKQSRRPPRTYGDLRKLLAAAGNPWQTNPTKSDDEPLPVYATGGDDTVEPADRRLDEQGVDALLRTATPPTNPDIRAAWREEGLLPDVDEELGRRHPKGRRKPPPNETPAPDSGG